MTGKDGTQLVKYLHRRDIRCLREWVDSMWWNSRVFETLYTINKIHMLSSYAIRIDERVKEVGEGVDI